MSTSPPPKSRFLALWLNSLAFVLVLGFAAPAFAERPGMVEFFTSGKTKRGLALVKLSNEVVVLGQDGWIHSLDPNGREPIRAIDASYQPVTTTEMRNDLRAEFGKSFEVLSTKNFLVVQPRGRGKRWPDLFEQSHRAFSAYMSKRGVDVREGRFPMVAIVFPDKAAMYGEFKRLSIDVSRVAGLYSNATNRVMTHDGGRTNAIAATVRHEAAHQSAFNSGVHSRVADTPKWITEGIGQMFEPSAMISARTGSQIRDRVNLESMLYIKQTYEGRNNPQFSEALIQLIGDDMMFDDDKQVDAAYAISWAMMFYLAERQPKAFARMLNHTAKRPPFKPYTRSQRLQDFERIVGVDTFDFSKRVSWFLQSL